MAPTESHHRIRSGKLRVRKSRRDKSIADRKLTLKKKSSELSTLCDVSVCSIILDPEKGSIETWPQNLDAVKSLLTQYRNKKSSQISTNPNENDEKIRVSSSEKDLNLISSFSQNSLLRLFIDLEFKSCVLRERLNVLKMMREKQVIDIESEPISTCDDQTNGSLDQDLNFFNFQSSNLDNDFLGEEGIWETNNNINDLILPFEQESFSNSMFGSIQQQPLQVYNQMEEVQKVEYPLIEIPDNNTTLYTQIMQQSLNFDNDFPGGGGIWETNNNINDQIFPLKQESFSTLLFGSIEQQPLQAYNQMVEVQKVEYPFIEIDDNNATSYTHIMQQPPAFDNDFLGEGGIWETNNQVFPLEQESFSNSLFGSTQQQPLQAYNQMEEFQQVVYPFIEIADNNAYFIHSDYATTTSFWSIL